MATRKNWIILGILALAQFMVVLDTSITNVALPALQQSLGFKPADLQWVITAYTLAFGGFLLLGGRAADLYGRRRIFIAGIVGFTIASALAGLAQNDTMMIAARALQGFAAAFMSPAALSIVLNTFTEGEDRNRALGVWSGVAAGGAAAGVLLGGVLTEYLGWRWDFLVNLPVGIGVIIAALRYVPEHKPRTEVTSLDLPGAALVTTGLMALVFGLTKAPEWGWTDASTFGWLAAAAALLIGFVINESRAKHPLVPLSIFRIRNVTGANLTQLPITAALFSMFFFLSLYVQQILGYSPVVSGLSFLPITFIIGITAAVGSNLIGRIGYKPFMVAAPLAMAAGLYLLSSVPVDGTYWADVFPGLAVMAFGAGLSFISVTVAATSGIAPRLSGLASGLLNTSQQIGGALGLAILSGVASSATADSLKELSPAVPQQLALATATVDGFEAAFRVGAVMAVTAAMLALVLVRQQKAEQGSAAKAVAMH